MRTSATPERNRRLLLVDDHLGAVQALARLLEYHDFQVEIAVDAASAQALLEQSPPGFLITDLSLPDRDGREIARLARSLPNPPRCVLVTGHPIHDDPQELEAWGIDRVFPKPIDVNSLVQYLREVTHAVDSVPRPR
jgi:CheY-like chemotaxis protein